MSTLKVIDIPIHLQGELYNYLTTEFIEDEIPFNQRYISGNSRPLKLNLKITGLKDILQLMDSCMFFAAPLHWKIFEFVETYPDDMIQQMNEFEHKESEYDFFMTTEEYRAIKLLATYKRTWTWSNQDFLEYAIKNGSLVLIEYYAPRYASQCAVLPLKWAADYGQIPIMSFLVKQPWVKLHNTYIHSDQTLAQQLCSYASANNQLPMLKYLREIQHFEWDKYTVQFSLCEERLSILKYAIENGCPIPEYSMHMALGMKTIEGLRILVEIGKIPINNPSYILAAAQHGNLECLQYLYERGAPWHPQAMNTAAREKHIECVEYGISIGAPFEPNIVETVYQPFDVHTDRWVGLFIYNSTRNE